MENKNKTCSVCGTALIWRCPQCNSSTVKEKKDGKYLDVKLTESRVQEIVKETIGVTMRQIINEKLSERKETTNGKN